MASAVLEKMLNRMPRLMPWKVFKTTQTSFPKTAPIVHPGNLDALTDIDPQVDDLYMLPVLRIPIQRLDSLSIDDR